MSDSGAGSVQIHSAASTAEVCFVRPAASKVERIREYMEKQKRKLRPRKVVVPTANTQLGHMTTRGAKKLLHQDAGTCESEQLTQESTEGKSVSNVPIESLRNKLQGHHQGCSVAKRQRLDCTTDKFRPKVAELELERVLEAATSLKTNNPTYLVRMKPSHVCRGFYMVSTVKFTRSSWSRIFSKKRARCNFKSVVHQEKGKYVMESSICTKELQIINASDSD